MSRPWTTWLAWWTCALFVLGVLASQGLSLINGGPWYWDDLAREGDLLLFSVIGALIAARQPGNAVGWLMCAFGVEGMLEALSTEYAKYALFAVPGSLPAGEIAAWLQSWSWAFAFCLMAFLLFLFPDGKLLSRRWRALSWVTAAASVLLATGMS